MIILASTCIYSPRIHMWVYYVKSTVTSHPDSTICCTYFISHIQGFTEQKGGNKKWWVGVISYMYICMATIPDICVILLS